MEVSSQTITRGHARHAHQYISSSHTIMALSKRFCVKTLLLLLFAVQIHHVWASSKQAPSPGQLSVREIEEKLQVRTLTTDLPTHISFLSSASSLKQSRIRLFYMLSIANHIPGLSCRSIAEPGETCLDAHNRFLDCSTLQTRISE